VPLREGDVSRICEPRSGCYSLHVSQTDSSSPGGRSPTSSPRRYRAGEAIEDYCRACHADRIHTVMAAGADGRPLRVVCGFCGSEHNYRGGPRTDVTPNAGDSRSPRAGAPTQAPSTGGPGAAAQSAPSALAAASARATPSDRAAHGARSASSALSGLSGVSNLSGPSSFASPLPLVSEQERIAPPISSNELDLSLSDQTMDLELLLRRIIREESGLTPVVPADKWRGGELVLRPGKPGLQDKTWPIDTFFHKIVMIRNRLRTLEQQLNASDLPDDVKVKLQGYVTGCYGTLTSFNVLFADEDDQFKGSSGGE